MRDSRQCCRCGINVFYEITLMCRMCASTTFVEYIEAKLNEYTKSQVRCTIKKIQIQCPLLERLYVLCFRNKFEIIEMVFLHLLLKFKKAIRIPFHMFMYEMNYCFDDETYRHSCVPISASMNKKSTSC